MRLGAMLGSSALVLSAFISGGAATAEPAQPDSTPVSDATENTSQLADQTPAQSQPSAQTAQSKTPRAATNNGEKPQYLNLQKTVNDKESDTLKPGDTLTYQIQSSCSEEDCVSAAIKDVLPDLSGFEVEDFRSEATNYAMTWYNAEGTEIAQPSTLAQGDYFVYTFTDNLGDGQVGQRISVRSIFLTLKVPAGFSPNDSRNDQVLTNTAYGTADNAADKQASADITVHADVALAATISKDWQPSQQAFSEGGTSTISMSVGNSSNVPVTKVVVVDPVTSASLDDGAATLSEDNPFAVVDFAGFAAGGKLPEGADKVQTDAYVFNGTTWNWVSGTPGTEFTLPQGVDAVNVGGLRFTFTGTAIQNTSDSAGTIAFDVAQRQNNRVTGADISKNGTEVKNTASAQNFLEDQKSAVVEDDATLKVTPPRFETSITKNFADKDVLKGIGTTGSIVAQNTGSSVETMTVKDLSFFDGDASGWQKNFGGFSGPIAYPQGATSAKVIYHLAGGETKEVTFGDNTTPANPVAGAAKVTGFEIVFSAPSGTNGIPAGAETTIPFSVATNQDAAVGGQGAPQENTATSTVTAANGSSATASDKDSLTIWDPAITTTIDKSVIPNNTPLVPGQDAIVSLRAQSKPTVMTSVDQVTIADEYDSSDPDTSFWNAFDLTSLEPTEVPAGYTLSFEVQIDGTWTSISLDNGDSSVARYVSLTSSELKNSVAAAANEKDLDDVTGVRFTLKSVENTGQKSTITVTPNLGFTARVTLRSGGELPKETTTYTNLASAQSSGTPDKGEPVTSGRVTDKDTAKTVNPEGKVGINYLGKSWNKDSVTELSQQSATTAITWNVQKGYNSVTLTDDPNATNIQDSVFNTFNLTGIAKIGASNTPYTNGWYLKWDTITAIELFDGTTWQALSAPNGAWQNADGSFKGVSLSADQQKSTIGVRITVQENTDARKNTTDPLAPEVGSGVATGVGASGAENGSNRSFTLNWQLRDKDRAYGAWVLNGKTYNTDSKSEVRNTVSLTADGTTLNATDEITILGSDANVTVTKIAGDTSLVVPVPGTVTESNYPVSSFTVTVQTNMLSKAQWVRLIDPNDCGQGGCLAANTGSAINADPWSGGSDAPQLTSDSPFNRLNITKLTFAASQAGQVDLANSRVWLLKYSNGSYSTVQTTAAAVNEMTAAHLQDVIGYAVTFTSVASTGAAGGGGLITKDNKLTATIGTQLRPTLRTTGEAQKVAENDSVDVENTVYAQAVRPEGVGEADHAEANGAAKQTLYGESIDIAVGKDITPAEIAEPARHDPVTVTLTANEGTSKASPTKVVLEDYADSSAFWNLMNFTALGKITAPSGANTAQLDVHISGGDWVLGTPSPIVDVAIPASVTDLTAIDGIRVTFTRVVDGKQAIFSDTNNPAWNASVAFTVTVRDTDRAGSDVTFPRDGVDNYVTGRSWGMNAKSDEKQAKDDVIFTSGSREIAIGKLANNGVRRVKGGATIPWDITIENTGTGYVTLTTVDDILPSHLAYIGQDRDGGAGVTYTVPQGVDEPTMSLSADGKTATFAWTGKNAKLAPGESVTIRIWLQLQPGVSANEKVRNTATVNTKEELAAITPITFDDDEQADISWDPDASRTSGDTWDEVTVDPGASISVFKGVKGSLDGATNWNDPSQVCATTTGLDGQQYYRSPCVANSVQGGTDSWVIQVANAGTTSSFDGFWVFDPLPTLNDQLIVSGNSRGSMFRPVLTGKPDIHLSGFGSQSTADIADHVTMQVTYQQSNVCAGTWNGLIADPGYDTLDKVTSPSNVGPCTQSGETWYTVDDSTDWAKVTGIRLQYLGSDDAKGSEFPAGAIAEITFQTRNEITTDTVTDGASNVIPVPQDELAWNQFGVAYTPSAGTGLHDKQAPNKVGVRLLNGSLEVTKEVTGEAASYAPDTFTASVACTVPDGDSTAPLYFSNAAGGKDKTKTVTLTKNAEGTYDPVRIHGIPIGATCSVTEDGANGSFGETLRSNPVSVEVLTADTAFDESGEPTNEVPQSQIATLTNTYDWGALSVTKKVETKADKGTFGPFDFEVSCKASNGTTITWPGATPSDSRVDALSFTLKDGGTWTAPEDTIPVGSVCTVSEVNDGDAAATSFTGDNVVQQSDGSAQVTVGAGTTALTSNLVTNSFDAGTLTVAKAVDGEGAGIYGTGEFTFNAACTYKDQGVLDEDFTLKAGDTKTFGVFPAGTQCQVVEQTTGGATKSVITPSSEIQIQGGATAADVGNVEVTATNTYDLGSLKITKVRSGSGAEIYGAGPFTAQVECTYQKDGAETPFDLPDGGAVTLSAENGYSAVVSDLIVGARCRVAETDDGGATSAAITPEDGTVTIPPVTVDGDVATPSQAEVTLTNTFETGSLTITKHVVGTGAATYGAGPFEATVACTWNKSGEETPIDLPNGGAVTLSKDNGYSATLDKLMVGASCSVAETDTAGAHNVELNPADGAVTITEANQNVDVTITNTFNTGSIQIVKVLKGGNAAAHANDVFKATVACEAEIDGTEVPLDLPGGGVVELSKANGYKATIGDIYTGATCTVKETEAGGANSVELDPADGRVEVGQGTTTVTITNTFNALPDTGADARGMALVAAIFVGLGGVILAVRRRSGNN